MHACIQLLTLEHNWRISTGNCFHHPLRSWWTIHYLPEEMVHITVLQQYWGVDGRCQNVAEQMVVDFFETGIQNLIPQYDTCLNSQSWQYSSTVVVFKIVKEHVIWDYWSKWYHSKFEDCIYGYFGNDITVRQIKLFTRRIF